ncbi:hypothetical protein PSY31_21785, partial [Shigella flexneri]|nr:hypothetical protein [Shigella flexneri]
NLSWMKPQRKMPLPKIDKVPFPFIHEKRHSLGSQNRFSLISNIMYARFLDQPEIHLKIRNLNKDVHKALHFSIEMDSFKKKFRRC